MPQNLNQDLMHWQKLLERAAILARQTLPSYMANRLLLDLAVRLEPIQQPDGFLDPDDLEKRRESTPKPDNLAIHNQHVRRIVLDFAELCINSGHVFRRITSVLESLFSHNIIRIHTFYKSQDDSIISLIIETKEGGTSCALSQTTKSEAYSTMHVRDVASYSDWEWQTVMDKTSSDDWRSVLAEMLCIQAYRLDIGLSERRLCKMRLRNLVRTHGVLPFSFHVSGLELPLYPISGGGFSDIYKGEFNKGAVCIKVLRIFTTELRLNKIYKELAREVLIWKELSHPNVLPLLGIDSTARKPSYCLVSPWMKNGNVMAFLERCPDFNKTSLVRGIANGLEYIHNLDPPVVHGDLKGANILINNDGQACLADFGLALVFESQALSTSSAGGTRGTLRWLAPEILDSSRKDERQALPTKRDIYAFGCTILEIYTGDPPFPNLQDMEVIHNVVTKRERPKIPSNAVAQLMNLNPLLKRCWHNDPQQRPNATEIGNVLQLKPFEWKKAVDGLTSPGPVSLFRRRVSAPLARRRVISNISLMSPTTTLTQSTSESESTQTPVKILLLGSGQSGKSTILKQFGISDVPSEFKSSIFSNVVAAMRTILKMMPELDIDLDYRKDRSREIILGTETIGEMLSLCHGIDHAIKMLSQDPGAQEAISYFSRHELSNSAEYFFDSIDRLAAENYVPTTEDILRLRVKTIGIYEKEVEFDGQTLIICDTGGERCERKKWIHCFPGTTVVFFLVALNDYQGGLEEDESVNRMNESVALWRDTVNAEHDSLKSAKFILLFNKFDLFVRHFEVNTFSAVFPDYVSNPGNEVLEALTYLRLKFLAQVHSEREVYTYEVSATDTEQFRDLWDTIKKFLF